VRIITKQREKEKSKVKKKEEVRKEVKIEEKERNKMKKYEVREEREEVEGNKKFRQDTYENFEKDVLNKFKQIANFLNCDILIYKEKEFGTIEKICEEEREKRSIIIIIAEDCGFAIPNIWIKDEYDGIVDFWFDL